MDTSPNENRFGHSANYMFPNPLTVSSTKDMDQQLQPNNRHQHALYPSNSDREQLSYYSQEQQNVNSIHHHSIQTIPEGSSMNLTSTTPNGKKQMSSKESTDTTSLGSLSSSLQGVGAETQLVRDPNKTSSNSLTLCSSPSGGLEQDDNETTASQRQKLYRYNPANYPVALKLLVSNNVAGSIIGRAGQTISELQAESKTRIKLSQSNEYYPGTQDRVCLIQGDVNPMKNAIRLLLERLFVLQENQHSQHMAWHLQRQKDMIANAPGTSSGAGQNQVAFDFVVRLLVPTAACGMIIGKSGSNIKFMEETTGVTSVRLSPKDNSLTGNDGSVFSPFAAQPNASMNTTSERIVTITSPSLDSCINCVNLIVDGMILHPDTSRYSNMTTSYSNTVTGTVIQQQHNQQQLSMAGSGATMIPSVSHPDLLLYSGGNNRQHQPLLVPLAVPSLSRHTASSPNHLIWENMTPNSPQYIAPHVGLSLSGSGLTRRIASSPDLHFDASGVQLKHQSSQSSIQNVDATNPPSADDRISVSRGTYEMSSVQHYSPAFSQPPMPQMPMISSNTTHHSFYVVQQQQQSVGHSAVNDGTIQKHPGIVPHSASAPNLLAIQLDHSLQISQTSSPSSKTPISPSSHHGVSTDYLTHANPSPTTLVTQTPTMIGPGCFSAQVLIPDSMIGSILGRGGKSLTELQMVSGTRIRISQRGEYIPGTPRDVRVVTIRGPTSQAVWQAQIIISQRIVLPSTATALTTGASNAQPYFQSGLRENVLTMQQQHRQIVVGYQHQQQSSNVIENIGAASTTTSSTSATAGVSNVTSKNINESAAS